MTKQKPLPPILELLGPEDSGKSTLARLFLESFSPEANILVLDPSPNQSIAEAYQLEKPMPSLTEAISALRHRHPSTAEMDWHLQELLIPLPINNEGDRDVLFIGSIPEYGLFQAESDLLTHGLPRLLQHVDLIIHDGPLGALEAFLKPFEVFDLIVIRPDDEAFCSALTSNSASIILSQAEPSDTPPESAQARINAGQWRLMGKVPRLPESSKDPNIQLPASFKDCFSRLDLPFALTT